MILGNCYQTSDIRHLTALIMYLYSGRRRLQLPSWIVLCPDQAFHHERTKSLRQTVYAETDED